MLIKGKAIDKDTIKSNTIYVIRKKREIDFIEPQVNDEDDRVVILYDLLPNQYGVFIKEYRPGFIDKEQCKKADILMLVVDEANRKLSSWMFDIKVRVGGEDVIFHLLEQLCDSYRHKNSITAYFPDFEEDEHIGFITREYQEERIRHKISARETRLSKEKENLKKMSSSTKFSIQRQLLKIEKEIQVLKQFLDGYIKIDNVLHPIEDYMSINNGSENICNMKVFV